MRAVCIPFVILFLFLLPLGFRLVLLGFPFAVLGPTFGVFGTVICFDSLHTLCHTDGSGHTPSGLVDS